MTKVTKEFVKDVTSMDEDFAQWYTDVVKKAELIDYSSVGGSMIIRPYGYAIWENSKDELDRRIKETGHQNVYMPLFIPESLLPYYSSICIWLFLFCPLGALTFKIPF